MIITIVFHKKKRALELHQQGDSIEDLQHLWRNIESNPKIITKYLLYLFHSLILKKFQAVTSGEIKCNFKGLAMGDSWISPEDSTVMWAPYLYTNVSKRNTDLKKLIG